MRSERIPNQNIKERLLSVSPKWFRIIFYLFLLVWMVGLLYVARGWDARWDRILPFMVGVPLLTLIAIQMIKILFPFYIERFTVEKDTESSRKKNEEADDTGKISRRQRYKNEVIIVLWTVSLPLLLHLFGFIVVLPIYLFGFVMFYSDNIKAAAGLTVAFMVVFYILFIQMLGMVLWTGIFDIPFLPF